MKRLLAFLLVLMMAFSLVACGGKDTGDDGGDQTSSSSSEQEEKTPEADEETAPSSEEEQEAAPAPDEGEDEPEETPAPVASEPEDWTDCFSLPGLTTPEGFVVINQNTRNATASDIRLGTAHFEKEGGFTEDEITAFAQMIWDACMEVSPDGIYAVAYVDDKPAAGTPYADLNAAHDTSYGYYGWDYTHDGVYISIQVDYGSRGDGVLRLGCSEYQSY